MRIETHCFLISQSGLCWQFPGSFAFPHPAVTSYKEADFHYVIKILLEMRFFTYFIKLKSRGIQRDCIFLTLG